MPVQGFDVAAVAARLAGQNGGYEVIHESPGLEIGVYVSANDDGRADVDEPVHALGLAFRQAHTPVRSGVRRNVG